MRSILFLIVLSVTACGTEPDRVGASWDDATVYVTSFERPLPIHTLFPTVKLRARIDNSTATARSFYLGGRNFRDGLILGGSEDDPARFLLVGPDTTLSFFATPSDRWRTYDDSLTIEPGASLDLLLVADNAWVAMRRSDPTFVEMDSVAFVNFFVRSLQHGHLLYAADSTSPDTLAFVRAPNARVEVVSPAP